MNYPRYYGRWHNDSPEHLVRMVRYFGGRLKPHLPTDHHARVLDVGCGMGFALETLRGLGFSSIEGIECDATQADATRARGFASAHVIDTTAWLQARPDHYDVVLLMDVLEHIPRDAQFDFLSAIHAALKVGGRIICSVPNANSTLGTRQRYMDWTHHTSFTEHSLDFALHHGGFHQIRVLADDGPAKRLPWLPLWRRRWWYVRGFFRTVRRWQLMGEFGPEEGRRAPLSPNLLGLAVK
ncbi:MAG: class I SAM-dependent methyltransferase [Opitutaceae bacterium]